MLLKYSQAQKRIRTTGIGKPLKTAGGMVKLTSGLMTVVPKLHRRVVKVANKRPATVHRTPALSAVKREVQVDPCENSNDSGLGFDHHLDYSHHSSLPSHSGLETSWPSEEPPEVKRRRLEIKLESDDANDNFAFQEAVRHQGPRTICVPVRRPRVVVPSLPLTLSSQLLSTSHDGLVQLLIVCQPEQQHRARYQTEGSRGAVKDRTGNGFPVVKLVGYDRPATLQVFIGTDQGKVAPHMFYQACRVSGKNSTPCVEKKIDGTIVIEVDIEPSKDMVVTCDCVGILKERNVDVEHRFPEEGTGRSKKKSTRCRMVFRTTITHPDGTQETLQVTSQPIVCTQPPGVPEICKKSLSSCSARGGQELFILGKNFLKDTRVVFQEGEACNPSWTQTVQPDKEFLQQSHLVCVIPPYKVPDTSEPVSVRLVVESSGKASEPHTFLYLPDSASVLAPGGPILDSSVSSQVKFLKASGPYRGPLLNRRRYRNGGRTGVFSPPLPVATPLLMPSEPPAPFLTAQSMTGKEEKVHPMMLWNKSADVMMPPPPPGLLPITVRRSSVQMIVPETLAPEDLKREIPDPLIDPVKPVTNVAELCNNQTPTMDAFHRYVNSGSLPSLSVGSYLSNIENTGGYIGKVIKSPVMNEIPRIMIPSTTTLNKPMFSGDSSNLLTTVDPLLVNQPTAMSFENRSMPINTLPRSPTENMSVIVNSSVIPKKSPDSQISSDIQTHKEVSESQNMNGLDILMSPLNKRTQSVTERLDAFVNSAAESHISPTPSSPTAGSSVPNENSRMNSISDIIVNGSHVEKLQDTVTSTEIQTSPLKLTPQSTPQHESVHMNEGSLCSLLNSSVQTSQQSTSNQTQAIPDLQATLEQHLNNQNINNSQPSISNLIQSPSHLPVHQTHDFSKIQSSMEQHLSTHSVSSTQMSSPDINSLMQPSQQPSSNQPLSDFQTSIEHRLSPEAVHTPINPTDLGNLMQTATTNQIQDLTKMQTSLEQEICSQTLNTTQINHCNINNAGSLMQTSTHDSRNEVQAMSNLQATLEQLSNQTVSTAQVIHSESMQSSNTSMNNVSSSLQTSHNSSTEIQSLSNIQSSYEHHLNSQGVATVQTNHESHNNESITLNNLNNSVSNSQIQVAVSQAQALSDFHASLQQHLSAQLSSVAVSNANSVKRVSSVDSSLESINQAQNLSNLQMSFEQVLNSEHQNREAVSANSITVTSSIQSSPQTQASVSQSQVLSNLQASLEHHLNSNVISTTESSQNAMSLDRLTSSLRSSPEEPSSQTLSGLQDPRNHITSDVLIPSSNHPESLSKTNIPINDNRNIDLRSSMPLMPSHSVNAVSNSSTTNSPMLSPVSRPSPASSVLTSPGISMSNTPTMALSPANFTNSQEMDDSTHNSLLGSHLNSSLNPRDLRVQNSQNDCIRPRYEQVSQNLPVQMTSMSHFDQNQELSRTNNETNRKDSPVYIMPSRTVASQPQRNYEIKQQTSEQTVKKCEEGMPLPHELTQMSEHDLISYINPSCFDTV